MLRFCSERAAEFPRAKPTCACFRLSPLYPCCGYPMNLKLRAVLGTTFDRYSSMPSTPGRYTMPLTSRPAAASEWLNATPMETSAGSRRCHGALGCRPYKHAPGIPGNAVRPGYVSLLGASGLLSMAIFPSLPQLKCMAEESVRPKLRLRVISGGDRPAILIRRGEELSR
jgi:hypothetical protein